jgi:hypothetical protein
MWWKIAVENSCLNLKLHGFSAPLAESDTWQ